jgi:hypothetical protein
MKCLHCPLKYTVQTGGTFEIRCKEYIQAIRNNNGNSEYSNHILNTRNTSGITTDKMDIIKQGKNVNT